jgi:hypothetical protein
MTTPNIPIVNLGNLYATGLGLAYASSTTMTVAAGQARDGTDTNDIVLSAPVTINVRANGANGLDIGTFAANTIYYVFVVGDSTEYNGTCALLSLSSTAPLLPAGYDMFRRMGAILSNATAAPNTLILPFHQRGRTMYYYIPIATAVVAGASTVWASVTVTAFIPTTALSLITQSQLTADAGGTRYVLYAADATVAVNALTIYELISTAPASVVEYATLTVPVTNTAGVMTIQYAVSNNAAAVAVLVGGYIDSI